MLKRFFPEIQDEIKKLHIGLDTKLFLTGRSKQFLSDGVLTFFLISAHFHAY